MFAEGKGVKQDFNEAVKWLRKAADQDYAEAQNNLGQMYEKGRGVKRDSAAAVGWYRKAARKTIWPWPARSDRARPRTPWQSSNGLNPPPPRATPTAPTSVDTLAKEMTPEQIAEAEKRVRDFVPKH